MFSRESACDQIRGIVADVADLPIEQVTSKAQFEHLGLDSLRGLRIVVEIEKLYDMVISEQEIAGIRSIEDILALVEAHALGG